MIHYDPGLNRLPYRAYGWRGTGSPDRALRRELMLLPRRTAALFVILALAGCASMPAGPEQTPNAPYQQGDPRDTSEMH
jgi:hypothetical protein